MTPNNLPGLALIALFGVAMLLVVVALARRARKKNAAVWMAYAASRGLSYTPSAGFGSAYRGPRMEGVVGGVPVLIDGYFHRLGRGPAYVTRVTRSSSSAGSVVVRPRMGMLLLGEEAQGAELPTGDLDFDTTFVVGSEPPGAAATLLPGTTRVAILAFAERRRGPYFDVDQARVSLRWLGFEKDASVLDEACRIVGARASAG